MSITQQDKIDILKALGDGEETEFDNIVYMRVNEPNCGSKWKATPLASKDNSGHKCCWLSVFDLEDEFNGSKFSRNEPPIGSWAATARIMAGPNPTEEDGEFWDRWKEEMKEMY